MPEIRILNALSYIWLIVYLIVDIYYIRKYKRVLIENYTTAKALINYKWLMQLIVIIISISAITMIKDILKLGPSLEVLNTSRIIMLCGGVVFLCWLVLKALYAPKQFNGIDSNFQLIKNIVDNNPVLLKNNKSDEQLKKIIEFITENETYLDPSLTIQKLADQLHMPAKELSVLINHHLNKHFFDFINEFRIKKAMQILKDPLLKELTILEILYDVGFNSKSPFNTAFKKHTNMTPTQYRNNLH
jgi:AraC-like DNA-binding protein